MALDHEHYMGIALTLARQAGVEGNRPMGALIVDGDGQILAQGSNRVYTDSDPTAHGEVVVIRKVSTERKMTDMNGCTIYASMEPCPMCCWAILEANLSRLVIGGRHAGVGRTDLGRYAIETLLELTGRSIEFVTGVRSKESEDMRLAWIAERAKRGLGPR